MLAWVGRDGQLISQAPGQILRAARCNALTPGLPRAPNHHQLVAAALALAETALSPLGGQLGPKSGARYRLYHALNRHHEATKNLPLFSANAPVLLRAIQEVHDAPLRPAARDQFNRLLKANAPDEQLADYALELYGLGQLGNRPDADGAAAADDAEPQILCSLGLS